MNGLLNWSWVPGHKCSFPYRRNAGPDIGQRGVIHHRLAIGRPKTLRSSPLGTDFCGYFEHSRYPGHDD